MPLEPGQLFVNEPWVERDGSEHRAAVSIAVTAATINLALATATIATEFMAENAVMGVLSALLDLVASR